MISAASPIGQALMGASPGTVATVELPNRRTRSVRLVDVQSGAGGWDDESDGSTPVALVAETDGRLSPGA